MKKYRMPLACIVSVLLLITFFSAYKHEAEEKVICYTAQDLTNKESELVRMLGRYSIEPNEVYFDYTLSGIEFEFVGSKCDVSFCSDFLSDEDKHAVIGVFLNDSEEESIRLSISKETCEYTVYESTKEEMVKIRLVKLSDAKQGTVGITQLRLYGKEPQIKKTQDKDMLFQFIGDSITCGMGNETSFGEPFTTIKENGNMSYGAITARNFQADVEFISYSGVGLIWGTSKDTPPMTEMYQYCGYTRGNRIPQLYNTEREPDIICVNLGTNDSKYIENEEEKIQFIETYVEFLKDLRREHPKALLVICYGTMRLEWKDMIKECYTRYTEITKDSNCEYLLFGEDLKVGDGCGGHPTVETHKNMAIALSELLEKRL